MWDGQRTDLRRWLAITEKLVPACEEVGIISVQTNQPLCGGFTSTPFETARKGVRMYVSKLFKLSGSVLKEKAEVEAGMLMRVWTLAKRTEECCSSCIHHNTSTFTRQNGAFVCRAAELWKLPQRTQPNPFRFGLNENGDFRVS